MWVRVGWWPEDVEDNPELPEFLEIPDDVDQFDVSRYIRGMEGIGVRPRGWAGPVSDEERGITREETANEPIPDPRIAS